MKKPIKKQLKEIDLLMKELRGIIRKKQTPHLSLINDLEIRLWAYDFEVRKEAGILTDEEEDAQVVEGELADEPSEH